MRDGMALRGMCGGKISKAAKRRMSETAASRHVSSYGVAKQRASKGVAGVGMA